MIQNIIAPIVLSVSSVSVGGVLLFKEIRDKSKTAASNRSNVVDKKPQQSLQSGQSSKNAISGLSKPSPQQQQQQSQQKQQKREQQQQQQQQQSRSGTTRPPTKQQMNDRSLLFKPDTLPRAEYTIAAYESDGPKRMDPLIREHNSNNNEGGPTQPRSLSFRRGIDASASNSDNSDSEQQQQQQQQRGGPNRMSPQAIRRLMNSD